MIIKSLEIDKIDISKSKLFVIYGENEGLKNELILNLGYSNPINFVLPDGIEAETENKGTLLKIKGINKEIVGEIAARIRKLIKPESYKGKGVRYQGEYVKLKAGKSAGGKGE